MGIDPLPKLAARTVPAPSKQPPPRSGREGGEEGKPPPRRAAPGHAAELTGHAEPDPVAALVAVMDVAGELHAAEVAALVGQGEALHAQREVVAARVAQQVEAAVQAQRRLAELAAPAPRRSGTPAGPRRARPRARWPSAARRSGGAGA